ncbi:unnamed protein product, partial [marine sediment metagenome]
DWDTEIAREEPDPKVLNDIMAGYALQVGWLYGRAYALEGKGLCPG